MHADHLQQHPLRTDGYGPVSAAKSILVTGAGGGLGGAAVALFAARGWRVFAADLVAPTAGPNVVALQVDVTSSESVSNAVARIDEDAPDGLDAVVTFAGIMHVGALVEMDDTDLRRLLDVNVLGTYRTVKAAFPLIHRKRGRVITISSETGWQSALMLNGPYAMSKHAVEAYSDALRRELMFLDIPVSTIRPGPFRTGMVSGIRSEFDRARARSAHFTDLTATVGRQAVREQERAHDPAVLAEVIWQAATTAKPRPHYSVRPDRRRLLLHYLPDRVADRLLLRTFRDRH